MATQKSVLVVRPATKSTTTAIQTCEESFPQFAARQWAAFCFELLDAIQNAALLFAWRYGCPHCNAKSFRRSGRGLLCARHFGELRRDMRRLAEYLAAVGRN
jgi:hypothetical protein